MQQPEEEDWGRGREGEMGLFFFFLLNDTLCTSYQKTKTKQQLKKKKKLAVGKNTVLIITDV